MSLMSGISELQFFYLFVVNGASETQNADSELWGSKRPAELMEGESVTQPDTWTSERLAVRRSPA
jgi:hypothetical protein